MTGPRRAVVLTALALTGFANPSTTVRQLAARLIAAG